MGLSGDSARRLCRGDNALDHLRLGLRLFVHIGPLFRGHFAFLPLVEMSVVDVSARAVREGQILLDLWAAGLVDIDVHVLFGSPEHQVLAPIPHPQGIFGRFQLGQIGGLVRGI